MTRTLATLALTLLASQVQASTAPGRYTQAAAGNSLQFTFTQLDAASAGDFKKFSTVLVFDENNLAGSSLHVTVDVGSLDTQDGERDGALKGADLFNAQQFPSATFSATSLSKSATGGFLAKGKLTLRGVTKDLALPLTLKPISNGVELTGATTIKRLDFGVGQGDWKSTDSVGDAVKIEYKVNLVRAQ